MTVLTDVDRGRLLELAQYLTVFQENYGIHLGLISPDDLEATLFFKEQLEQYKDCLDASHVYFSYGEEYPDRDNFEELKSDIETTDQRIRDLSLLLDRFFVWGTKALSQHLLLCHDYEKTTATDPGCWSMLLNIPTANYVGMMLPPIKGQKPRTPTLFEEFFDEEYNRTQDHPCSLSIPPSIHTWTEYLHAASLVAALSDEERKLVHLSPLTGDAKTHRSSTNKTFHWAKHDLVALWIRAQRSTEAMRHLISCFTFEVENDKLIAAEFRGNSRVTARRVINEAPLLEILASWAITNQVLITHPAVIEAIQEQSTRDANVPRKRFKFTNEDNRLSDHCLSRLVDACHFYILCWIARRYRHILSILFYSDPEDIDHAKNCGVYIHDDTSWKADLIVNLSKKLQVGDKRSTDRTLPRIGRRVRLGKYNGEHLRFDVVVQTLLKALIASVEEMKFETLDYVRALEDFVGMYRQFRKVREEFGTIAAARSLLDRAQDMSPTELADILLETPTPWVDRCQVCEKSLFGQHCHFRVCACCDHAVHVQCDQSSSVQVRDIIRSSPPLKDLFIASTPRSLPIPDFRNEVACGLTWEEKLITITRRVLDDENTLEKYGIEFRHTESMYKAFESITSLDGNLMIWELFEIAGQFPLATNKSGLVVTGLHGDSCSAKAGVKVGDVIVAARPSSYKNVEEDEKFEIARTMTLSNMTLSDRLFLFERSATTMQLVVLRPNRDIVAISCGLMQSVTSSPMVKILKKTLDITDTLWFCSRCRNQTDNKKGDTNKLLSEAESGRAIIRYIGLESCGVSYFHMGDGIQGDKGLQYVTFHLLDIALDQLLSLRPPDQIFTYLCQTYPVLSHLDWFNTEILLHPLQLTCRFFVHILKTSSVDDSLVVSELLASFIRLYYAWGIASLPSSGVNISTKGPRKPCLYLRDPSIDFVDFKTKIFDESSVSLSNAGRDSEVLDSIDFYEKRASIVGSIVLAVPGTTFHQRCQDILSTAGLIFDNDLRPTEWLIASYLPATSGPKNSEGTYHLLPAISQQQLQYLVDHCILRSSNKSSFDENITSWKNDFLFNLDGVLTLSSEEVSRFVVDTSLAFCLVKEDIERRIEGNDTILSTCRFDSSNQLLKLSETLLSSNIKALEKVSKKMVDSHTHVDVVELDDQVESLLGVPSLSAPLRNPNNYFTNFIHGQHISMPKCVRDEKCRLLYTDHFFPSVKESREFEMSPVFEHSESDKFTCSVLKKDEACTDWFWGLELLCWDNDEGRVRVGRVRGNASIDLEPGDVVTHLNGKVLSNSENATTLTCSILMIPLCVKLTSDAIEAMKLIHGQVDLERIGKGPLLLQIHRGVPLMLKENERRTKYKDHISVPKVGETEQGIEKPSIAHPHRTMERPVILSTVEQDNLQRQVQDKQVQPPMRSELYVLAISSIKSKIVWSEQPLSNDDLYRQCFPGNPLTRIEHSLLMEAIRHDLPMLGLRMLSPRYDLSFLMVVIRRLQSMKKIPAVSLAKLYHHFLFLDYARSSAEPDTDPYMFSDTVTSQSGITHYYKFRMPQKPLPIDREAEKYLFEKSRSNDRGNIRIRGGGYEISMPPRIERLNHIDRTLWRGVFVYATCNTNLNDEALCIGFVKDILQATRRGSTNDGSVKICIFFVSNQGLVDPSQRQEQEWEACNLFLVKSDSYEATVVENFKRELSDDNIIIVNMEDGFLRKVGRSSEGHICCDVHKTMKNDDYEVGVICGDQRMSVRPLGVLPDHRRIYWFVCDPNALYISAFDDIFKEMEVIKYEPTSQGRSSLMCPWRCVGNGDDSCMECKNLCDLQSHLKSSHSLGGTKFCYSHWELHRMEGKHHIAQLIEALSVLNGSLFKEPNKSDDSIPNLLNKLSLLFDPHGEFQVPTETVASCVKCCGKNLPSTFMEGNDALHLMTDIEQSTTTTCKTCSLATEKIYLEKVGTESIRACGCMLISDLCFPKDGLRERFLPLMKHFLLRVAGKIPVNVSSKAARATVDSPTIRQFCSIEFWNEGRYEQWRRIVERSRCLQLLAQAFVILKISVNRSLLPDWWGNEGSGWASILPPTHPSPQKLLQQILIFDLALTETISLSIMDRIDIPRDHFNNELPESLAELPMKERAKILLRMAKDDLNLKIYEGDYGSYCSCCQDGGDLLCCELCPNVQHEDCRTLTSFSSTSDAFICDACIRDISTLIEKNRIRKQ